MGLLGTGVSLFNKNKKKKDVISQTALAAMMEKSSNGKEFMGNMDSFLKNKKKEEISIEQQITTQQKRLNLSDDYLADLPVEKSITATKRIGTLIGGAAIGLIEQAASSYIDLEILKTRDVSKQARLGNIKSFGAGLAASITGGAIAGAVFSGPGGIITGIVSGLIFTATQIFSSYKKKQEEDIHVAEANKEAQANIITLGNIASTGNRKFR